MRANGIPFEKWPKSNGISFEYRPRSKGIPFGLAAAFQVLKEALFGFGQLTGFEQKLVSGSGLYFVRTVRLKAEWPPEGGLPGEKLGCADSDAAEFGNSG